MKIAYSNIKSDLMTVLLVGTALTTIIANASVAQTKPEEVRDGTGSTEVIVTAQRRSEKIQSVPIAVSALSSLSLANNNIHSLQDMSASVPGFVATSSAGYGAAPLSIRGVGGANGGGNFFADEPVATYIDGVYIGRLSAATSDVVDVDNIQILRGPQGTLYGRNSTAGALLINTKRPTKFFQGEAQQSMSSLGDWRTETAISGPIVGDIVLGRLAAAYSDHEGWGKNVITGKKVNNGHDVTVRGSLRYVPTEEITIDLIGEHFDQHFNPGLFRVANVTGGPADSPYSLRSDFKDAEKHSLYAADENTFNHIATDTLTAAGEWRSNIVTLNWISAYRRFDVDGLADSDNTAPADRTGGPLRSYNSARLRNTQVTHELRASSAKAASNFTWTAGLFFIHENNAVDPFIISTSTAYFGLGTQATFDAVQHLDSSAAFADVSYKVTDRLTLRAGIRSSNEKKVFLVSQSVVTLMAGFSPALHTTVPVGFAVAAPPTFNSQASFRNTSGRLVADYKFTNNILGYVNYSQGFKSGGFNAFGLTPAFRPETINAYEAGIKSDLFSRKLRLNLDVFDYDYSDLQVRQGVPTGGVSIVNAGPAKVRGAELETVFTPVNTIKFGLNVTHLNAKFVAGKNPAFSTLQRVPLTAAFKFGANLPLESVSIVGNSLSRAPEWQVGATAEYKTSLSQSLSGTFGANLRYQSNEYFTETAQTTNTFKSGDWTEVGVRLTINPKTTNAWSLTVSGDNIFNNRHLTQVTPLSAFPYGTLNQPERWTVRLSEAF